jgi:mRNA-degrading endonuclease toxin of MazEF toxin-antitoxin module
MKKDFDSWNTKKKEINSNSSNRFYHQREVWWCSLGVNVGYEQDGKDHDFQRPVLILKGLSKETCLIAPFTTSRKNHIYRILIGTVTGKESRVILSQIKVIDTKRLINRIAILDTAMFELIRKSIKEIL